MRNSIVAAVTAFVIGGAATGALVAHAQSIPPAPVPSQEVMDAPPPHAWMQRMRGPHMEGPGFGTFALVYRQQDRQLSPADVQKIAEAFLLWNGNHAWKVADVSQVSDNAIGFTLTTQEGSVIAKFTMDPHTAKVTRTG